MGACRATGETLSWKCLARKQGGEEVSMQVWAEVHLGIPVTQVG